MKISVFNYWYKCIKCGAERSVSSSNPLEYYIRIKCPECQEIMAVKGLKSEPEIELEKYQPGTARKIAGGDF